jgi:nucleoside-diphosphate-sugar epimerase
VILLTGSTGFVGRNLLLRLLAEGREVAVSVRSPEKLAAQLRAEGLAAGPSGLRVLPPDPATWPALPLEEAVLGAGVLFARSKQEYWTTNVDWTLEILRRLPADCRTVLISSQAAGGPTPAGKSERSSADVDAPITWYGESKLALEQAVRKEFPGKFVTILRPPMILGARDTATLPLFRMAKGLVRIKPGLRGKTYSFVDVADVVEAILKLLAAEKIDQALYPAMPEPITDWELIGTAAAVCQGAGITLPVPELAVRILSAVVDAVPSLRNSTPSLTRDRAKDIWEARWVVDGSELSRLTGWLPRVGLRDSLQAACDFYRREGVL